MNFASRRLIKLAIDIEKEVARATATNPWDVISWIGAAATGGGALATAGHGWANVLDESARIAEQRRAFAAAERAVAEAMNTIRPLLEQLNDPVKSKELEQSAIGYNHRYIVTGVEELGKVHRALERLEASMEAPRRVAAGYARHNPLTEFLLYYLRRPTALRAGTIMSAVGLPLAVMASSLASQRRQKLLERAIQRSTKAST
jgi:hypothetical protein